MFACLAGATASQGQDTAGVQDKTTKSPAEPEGTIPPVTSTESADTSKADESASASDAAATNNKTAPASDRVVVLIGSLTIFILAIFVGFEIINKVPPTLHTPLMSGSNAISGITIVGALLATGFAKIGFGSFFGLAAIVLAMINVAGGFWVTHRMLAMFKKK
ncbi:MAG: NAD(P) transhydrogenase subunit alpha [Planctomycetes bacterium]|nr:NAD(P) transhydrogenase subunit alpha [Planctomycetota bacterium]